MATVKKIENRMSTRGGGYYPPVYGVFNAAGVMVARLSSPKVRPFGRAYWSCFLVDVEGNAIKQVTTGGSGFKKMKAWAEKNL